MQAPLTLLPRLVGKLVLSLALLWPLGLQATASFPSFENVTYTRPSEAWHTGDISFTKCRVNDPSKRHYQSMDCGYFVVNENPEQSDGAKITLFIGRLPAIGKSTEEDPLLLIDGGPGGAPSESFILPGRGFEKIRQQRDVYLIDQRGTGKSARLDCARAQSFEVQTAGQLSDLTQECLQSLDGDPRMYTTSVAVQDLEAVRLALGVRQWNLYGVSYGSRVAQHYLRRYPAATRSLILDGVVPPDHNLGPDIALESQRALEQLIQRCMQSRPCSKSFGDLEAGISKLFHRLKQQSVHIEIDDYSTGQRREFEFTERHLMLTIRLSLYNPATMAILPLLLHEAYARQNFGPLARNAEHLLKQLENAMAMGMHNSVMCAEDVANVDAENLNIAALQASYMGEEVIEGLLAICSLWPKGPVDTDFKTPLKSDVPVLLLSGSVDPITPPVYAERVAEHLSNSMHIVAEGFGHGIANLGCIPTVMADFIGRASVSGLASECVKIQTPDPFFVDFNGPLP